MNAMNLKVIFLLLLSLSLVSCSQTQRDQSSIDEAELLDGVEDPSGLDEGSDLASIDEEESFEEQMADSGSEALEDESVDEVMNNAQLATDDYSDLGHTAEADRGPSQDTASSEIAEYTVEENDSLMLISYKIYGDYLRWRELLRSNPGLSQDDLKAGTKIQYMAPATPFNDTRKGLPYLILKGDTLGIISGKVYGTSQKWKALWNNNRSLIKDPNLIFAGFTLYYLEKSTLASN